MPALRDTIVHRLKEIGVRALFGMPGGGANLDLIDAQIPSSAWSAFDSTAINT